MSGSKLTPGPWEPDELTDGFIRIWADHQVVVAALQAVGMSAEECQANARVMAAAKHLLRACRVALEFLDCDPRADDPWTLRGRLRNAIARATEAPEPGEQS